MANQAGGAKLEMIPLPWLRLEIHSKQHAVINTDSFVLHHTSEHDLTCMTFTSSVSLQLLCASCVEALR